MKSKEAFALYLRNFVFGVEDSLVSTVGVLSGVAIAGVERQTVFLTGIVLIFVEAFAMAAGSFLSEHSVEDYIRHAEAPFRASFVGATVMFFSYFVSGFIPLFPYLIASLDTAFGVSIILTMTALFILGAAGAKAAKVKVIPNGLRMLLIGGLAIGVGIAVAKLVN